MSGPEFAVLACGPAGEPKAKASSQASNVLHRQHHKSYTSYTAVFKRLKTHLEQIILADKAQSGASPFLG